MVTTALLFCTPSRWPESQALWTSYYLASGLASCLQPAWSFLWALHHPSAFHTESQDTLIFRRVSDYLAPFQPWQVAPAQEWPSPVPLRSAADRGRQRGCPSGPQLGPSWALPGGGGGGGCRVFFQESISYKNLLCAVASCGYFVCVVYPELLFNGFWCFKYSLFCIEFCLNFIFSNLGTTCDYASRKRARGRTFWSFFSCSHTLLAFSLLLLFVCFYIFSSPSEKYFILYILSFHLFLC